MTNIPLMTYRMIVFDDGWWNLIRNLSAFTDEKTKDNKYLLDDLLHGDT